MDPYFGPGREETLRLLRDASAHERVPITLGDGMPSFVVDCRDGNWLLYPLVIDSAAAERVHVASVDNSGLWTWEFLDGGEPIFATPSKDEFVRWLEVWPWLGSGVRRAAPPSTQKVTAVTIDFEHLALPHRTAFRWARGEEPRALEPVDIEIEREHGHSREVVDAPAHIWSEFLDILSSSFPEQVPMLAVRQDAATKPSLQVPERLMARRPEPDAPTVPSRVVDTMAFLRCRISFTEAEKKRDIVLDGPQAAELMTFVFDFAAEFGVALPR